MRTKGLTASPGVSSSGGLTPSRLEAISDGVIAVIITIMVLELKVPGPDGLAGLRAVLPTIFLYLLTFVQIGIYWVNHHYLVDEAETVTHGILWANLVFLFFLSLFPFATDWIGVKGLSSFTTALYAAVSIFPGLAYMGIWVLIRRQSAAPAHASWGKQIASVSLYLAADPRGLLEALGLTRSDRDCFSDLGSAAEERRAGGEIGRDNKPGRDSVGVGFGFFEGGDHGNE